MPSQTIVRVTLSLNMSHDYVKTNGDMKTMYAVTQAILKNSGGSFVKCGWTGKKDIYHVDYTPSTPSFPHAGALLLPEERSAYGVTNVDVTIF